MLSKDILNMYAWAMGLDAVDANIVPGTALVNSVMFIPYQLSTAVMTVATRFDKSEFLNI